MNPRFALCASALSLFGSALADTGVKVVSNTIPFTDTNWSLPLVVPQFNVPGGTLTSVDIAFSGDVNSSLTIENLDSTGTTFTASASYLLNLISPTGAPLLSLTPTIKPITKPLAAYDGIDDDAGTSGLTLANITASATNSTTLTNANDLAAFIGSGNVSFPVAASAKSTITGPANADDSIYTQADAAVTVTYHYTYQAPVGSIGDRVFFDANGNGIQDDGEKGVANVPVSLLNAQGLVKTTTTDADGYYLFSGLPAGSYTVQFGKPSGYAFTLKDAGNDDAKDSDADATGLTPTVTLAAGQDRLDVDAGLVGTLCLGDQVFLDCNKDGIKESNESGVPNVPVHLFDANGTNLANATTDGNGFYKFSNLAPGNYSVKFDAPAAYGFTTQFAKLNGKSYPALDSNVDPATGLATVTLASTDLTIDAGLVPALKVCGTIWGDCDGDGNYEPNVGEKGFPCVRVWLGTNLDCFGIPHAYALTTTDKDGHYEFDGLSNGYYVVGVYTCDLPSGVTPSYDPDGTWTANFYYGNLCNADFCGGNFGYKPVKSCGGCSHNWWSCNPDCWPCTSVTIGGKCHPKSVACAWLKQTNCFDMSVCLYQRLCAAKLNVACGSNHSVVLTCGKTTCSVADAILKCDAWMTKHPVGCNVSANCADWASISDCFGILDKYCGGK